ncbi:MAG TPA: hypothetical protein VFX05_07965 [Casimicrobiaceae bacterium]|nr:hypothetical protein [Casimicrobiaceae bacterium]
MTARRLFLAAAALALAGCASTTIRDSWVDPAYSGPGFRRILVLGVSSDVTNRRVFEDIMAQRIAATGVEAIPAYVHLPESGKVPETTLDAAVKASGADALVMSRVRQIDRRTDVYTSMAPGPAFAPWGWYGWYSGWYPVTEVRQYDIAVVETTVFDAASKRVVWTGMTETYAPRSIREDAPGFADVIVRALAERGLLPARR